MFLIIIIIIIINRKEKTNNIKLNEGLKNSNIIKLYQDIFPKYNLFIDHNQFNSDSIKLKEEKNIQKIMKKKKKKRKERNQRKTK